MSFRRFVVRRRNGMRRTRQELNRIEHLGFINYSFGEPEGSFFLRRFSSFAWNSSFVFVPEAFSIFSQRFSKGIWLFSRLPSFLFYERFCWFYWRLRSFGNSRRLCGLLRSLFLLDEPLRLRSQSWNRRGRLS